MIIEIISYFFRYIYMFKKLISIRIEEGVREIQLKKVGLRVDSINLVKEHFTGKPHRLAFVFDSKENMIFYSVGYDIGHHGIALRANDAGHPIFNRGNVNRGLAENIGCGIIAYNKDINAVFVEMRGEKYGRAMHGIAVPMKQKVIEIFGHSDYDIYFVDDHMQKANPVSSPPPNTFYMKSDNSTVAERTEIVSAKEAIRKASDSVASIRKIRPSFEVSSSKWEVVRANVDILLNSDGVARKALEEFYQNTQLVPEIRKMIVKALEDSK